jgi:hypothetical protein
MCNVDPRLGCIYAEEIFKHAQTSIPCWWLSLVGLMSTMILRWNLCCHYWLGREIYVAVSVVFVIGTALLQSDPRIATVNIH